MKRNRREIDKCDEFIKFLIEHFYNNFGKANFMFFKCYRNKICLKFQLFFNIFQSTFNVQKPRNTFSTLMTSKCVFVINILQKNTLLLKISFQPPLKEITNKKKNSLLIVISRIELYHILKRMKIQRNQMKDEIKQDSQFQSEQEILLPMCAIPPANEIITKKYEPDQVSMVKLISLEDLKQMQGPNSLNQPKTPEQQFQQYGRLFETQDFLGRHYANKLKQITYFKFNNKDFHQLKFGEKKYRFFAGFFIQRQHFYNTSSQKHDNIMKTFPLDFVDYNSNLNMSFGKNNYGTLQDPKFSSNYDSANLFAVIRKTKKQYDLILQNDTNSKGNNQWFNFVVHFPKEGTYKFNIVNFVLFFYNIQTKKHSLYQKGMRIACYSFTKQMSRGFQDNQKNGSGWFRDGKNITYSRNQIQRQAQDFEASYYTLSFEYTCKLHSQTVAFAYTYPYSGLELEKYFNKMLYKRVVGQFRMQKLYLCNSVSGQPIYYYSISHKKSKFDSLKLKNSLSGSPQRIQSAKGFNFSKSLQKGPFSSPCNEQSVQMKSVVLMARQHPGEVQSSYVLEGIVDFLMISTELDQTKKNFIFFIFPMINVDGVKYGHYRTNLCGVDLNRMWRSYKKQIHPQVYYLKRLLYEANRTIPISLVLDIHGHSKDLNSFFYGNPPKKENLNYEDPKLFPFLCSKKMKQISYKQCTFSIRENKKNSARVFLGEMFPKALVYTFENSFYGYDKNKDQIEDNKEKPQIIEYTSQGYRKVGRQLIITYLEYVKMNEKNSSIKAKWLKEMEAASKEIQKQKCNHDNNEEGDEGSDSQIQNEIIVQIQVGPDKCETEIWEDNSSSRKLWRSKMSFNQKNIFISRKNQKKKTMPLPKTICEETVRGYLYHNNAKSLHNLKDFNNKAQPIQQFENMENVEVKNPFDIAKKPQYPQPVLSMFKIQAYKPNQLRKNASINTLLSCQQNPILKERQQKVVLSPRPKLMNGYRNRGQRQPYKSPIIDQKIKKNSDLDKKATFQQVMNKYKGMKTFLKAMGITIENKKC